MTILKQAAFSIAFAVLAVATTETLCGFLSRMAE